MVESATVTPYRYLYLYTEGIYPHNIRGREIRILWVDRPVSFVYKNARFGGCRMLPISSPGAKESLTTEGGRVVTF